MIRAAADPQKTRTQSLISDILSAVVGKIKILGGTLRS